MFTMVYPPFIHRLSTVLKNHVATDGGLQNPTVMSLDEKSPTSSNL